MSKLCGKGINLQYWWYWKPPTAVYFLPFWILKQHIWNLCFGTLVCNHQLYCNWREFRAIYRGGRGLYTQALSIYLLEEARGSLSRTGRSRLDKWELLERSGIEASGSRIHINKGRSPKIGRGVHRLMRCNKCFVLVNFIV